MRLLAANNLAQFRPEPTVIFLAASLPGMGKRLAREACRDEVASNVGNRSNVFMDWDVCPMLSEDCSAVRVNLAEGDCPHSCSLKPETESADSGEEIEDTESHTTPTCRAT